MGKLLMNKSLLIFTALTASAISLQPSLAQWPVPPKDVRLSCSPLPYVFDCSISRMPNPQFTSRCFYVANGDSTLMRSDHRMGFYNDIVRIKVDAGLQITASVTELNSGAQASCTEEE